MYIHIFLCVYIYIYVYMSFDARNVIEVYMTYTDKDIHSILMTHPTSLAHFGVNQPGLLQLRQRRQRTQGRHPGILADH